MNLKALRQERKWSQKRLASESGISQGYISYLEREMKQPTLPVLLKLAAALGVGLTEFLGGEAVTDEMAGNNKSLQEG